MKTVSYHQYLSHQVYSSTMLSLNLSEGLNSLVAKHRVRQDWKQ
jgi:hypothetical protein